MVAEAAGDVLGGRLGESLSLRLGVVLRGPATFGERVVRLSGAALLVGVERLKRGETLARLGKGVAASLSALTD